MKIATFEIECNTRGEFDLIEITKEVQNAIEKTQVTNGIAVVTCQHTTAGILVNENEQGFFEDLKKMFEKIAPKREHYEHNNMHKRKMPAGECKNGHSHLLASLLSCSKTLPIVNGALKLGVWQEIFLIELDSARNRKISITVIGE